MAAITTATGDFIGNGVVRHCCFARPTHEYLNLDAGKDFDEQTRSKAEIAEDFRHHASRDGDVPLGAVPRSAERGAGGAARKRQSRLRQESLF